MGKITKKDFKWLNKAVSTDDGRFNLSKVYCDGKNLVSTDGHRLHILNGVGKIFEVGHYNKNNKKVKFDWSFPDYHMVIPDKSKMDMYKFNIDALNKLGKKPNKTHKFEKIYSFYIQLPHQKGTNYGFNFGYLKDALSGFNGDVFIYYSHNDEEMQILIESTGNKQAVIKPLKEEN